MKQSIKGTSSIPRN